MDSSYYHSGTQSEQQSALWPVLDSAGLVWVSWLSRLTSSMLLSNALSLISLMMSSERERNPNASYKCVFCVLVAASYYPNDTTSAYQGNGASFVFNILSIILK